MTHTPDCTCYYGVTDETPPVTIGIIYCPMHKAAPELLEACKAVVANLVDENGCNWCDCAVWVGNGHADWCPIPSAIAAIARAEPAQ